MKKIALINHGCAKNLVDSELMLGILSDAGYKITLDDKDADIVIVNTCSFIHDAEEESVSSILEMINERKKVIVTGCLPQKHKKELQKALPEAVAFLGTSDYQKIAEVVKSVYKGSSDSIYEVSDNPCYKYDENSTRQQITVGASSYLKIADGCNFECGYCVIPKLRGKYNSRKIESIVDEAKILADKGVSEIVLIAQDTTSYGIDLYGKPSLAQLLVELNKIQNLNWIRIMYTYPTMIDDELLHTIAKLDKVVKYIDVPLQHCSQNVLKSMKRPVQNYKELIQNMRNIISDLALRTTFIVGYPGETEEDFEELYQFVEETKFDKLGVFEFCREKGTYAYSLPNQVYAKDKKRRKNKIMKLQQKISKQINADLIGQNINCIVESITDEGMIVARSYKDAPEVDGLVFVTSEDFPVPGDIISVKITSANEYDLFGTYKDN
ncbi:MAG: 30S ribosomal protein S12 methylthiotransferase RimO [Candidatus Gastranaerophilales bacterium]|nr:30S ribosomal protein S12 methylthiotransferase RimO [Candidatus Gastranaerophilales bacterium]